MGSYEDAAGAAYWVLLEMLSKGGGAAASTLGAAAAGAGLGVGSGDDCCSDPLAFAGVLPAAAFLRRNSSSCIGNTVWVRYCGGYA